MVHIDTDTITKPRVVRLLVQGQLDLTAVGAFGEALTRATRLRRPVEIDLAQIDFIDGCGLSMLMNATSRARRAGHELAIVDASRNVRRLIEVTDTADRLPPLTTLGSQPPACDDMRDGAQQDLDVAPHGPGVDVAAVDRDHLMERGARVPENLPVTGYPRRRPKAGPVDSHDLAVLLGDQRSGTDEAHLSSQHVE